MKFLSHPKCNDRNKTASESFLTQLKWYRICQPFLRFMDPEITQFVLSIFIISGSRNCCISAVSGSRNYTISTISGSRFFFVHFYNFWIQKMQYFCSFWIQKVHHFYNLWGPYASWGEICLAPAGGPIDRRACLNLT